jgi:class 3 adenylate cyclase
MAAPTTRNLTILLTDIKGFTDKTSRKSRAEIQTLLSRHNELVLPVLKGRGGTLVKTMGDAFLMTYESPTDAVLAGVEAQAALRAYNVGKRAADRIEIRVAINQGEVNLVDGDIFGEPVNITARIEAVADAGDVFFTEAIYLAMNKREVPSSEVGLLQLKGIPEKVRVYRVRPEQPGGAAARLTADDGREPSVVAERPAPAESPAPPAPAARPSRLPLIGLAVAACVAAAAFAARSKFVLRPAPAPSPSSPSAPATGSPAARFGARSFPSIYEAWSPPGNSSEDPMAALAARARRDLIFTGAFEYKLKWDNVYEGLASAFTPDSLADAKAERAALLGRNPYAIRLLDIRYQDADGNFLPADHKWWLRDAQGRRVAGASAGHYQLNFGDASFRESAAARCRAAVLSGALDGCYFNAWQDDPDHVDLARKVRAAIGDDALIVVGSGVPIPQSLPYVSGVHIVSRNKVEPADWRYAAKTLGWFQERLREPKIICFENMMPPSADSERWTRFTTTLVLTHTDGYALFSTLVGGNRGYDWQPFWDHPLGRPLDFGQPRPDGSVTREFARGTAVFNPIGNPAVRVRWPEPRTSAASGRRGSEFVVAPADGDFFLK